MNKKNINGFSLVELLIVIAIIIILGTISVIALNNERTKARDDQRISDIQRIRTALEFYHSDENEYPVISQAIILGSSNYAKLCAKATGGFVAEATPCNQDSTYMAMVPSDPLGSHHYQLTSSSQGYDITFTTEMKSNLGLAGTYHAHSQIIDQQAGNK